MKTGKFIAFDQAKEIADLCREKGVELLESEYIWFDYLKATKPIIYHRIEAENRIRVGVRANLIPAYDCQELFEIIGKNCCNIRLIYPNAGLWNFQAMNKVDIKKVFMPQVLGEYVIYLLKNDLI